MLLEICGNKFLTVFFNLIPDVPELMNDLRVVAGGFCRIRKVVMKFFCPGWKIWTSFFSIITNRNNVIKIDVPVFVHIVRCVLGYINVVFFHDFNCPGIYAMPLHTSAIDFRFVTCEMLQITLRHLAPTTVAGAQHKDLFHLSF